MGTLAYKVAGASSVRLGNTIYLFGGTGDWINATDSIQFVTIDSQGTPGAFSKATGSLAVARLGSSAQIVGPYVYVVGGKNSSGSLGSIERAPIRSDSTLGAFETVTGVNLASPRTNLATLYTGPFLYAIGGHSGSQYLSTVDKAAVGSDGSLGAFSTATGVTLSSARWAFSTARIGDLFYAIGGEASSGALLSIEKATIASDGTLSTFSALSQSLSKARNRSTAIALSGTLYLFGGWSQSFLSAVDAASIGADNTLGTFATATGTTLATAVEDGTGILTSSAVYYFGGHDGSGVVNSIQKAPIQ